MTVSNIDSSILETLISQYDTTDTVSSNDNSMMEMDDFLTVFLAQLQYQDPLNPMEGTEMTTQLSAISTVEQLYNVNEKLDTVSEKLENLSSSDPLDYLGKDVVIEGSEIAVQDGETLNGITFTLDEAAKVTVTIYDAWGNEVRQIQYGSIEAGSHMLNWDGRDNEGLSVEDGTYSYEVQAINDNAQEISVETQSQWRVTGIGYESGTPYLLAGDIRLDPESVIRVYDPSEYDTEDGAEVEG